MLRRLLLYLSAARWAQRLVIGWELARRVARRFVAGETLDEAAAVARALNARGLAVTLDCLGESVTRADDAAAVVDAYRAVLARISLDGLDASISLKLTHLGLDISEALCLANLRQILADAQARGIPVTIDMESSAHTEATLRLYRTVRDADGFANVGTVIQAYLRRSATDMEALAAEGAHIRLCKGAYLEPPEIAFLDKAEVDANFIRLAAIFLDAPPPAYLCIATHDERMIAATERHIRDRNIPRDRYEYQMLYGIRSARQEELARAGHRMRVYVPFGTAWYPYFMRRLAERPANLWFFARSLFRR